MNSFSFFETEDGSTGLYSNIANDILHSKTGALKESYEKFINPILECEYENKNEVNILDICSGIGYNLKAALNKFKFNNISIDSIDTSKTFLILSPFINDNLNNIDIKLFILASLLSSGINIDEITEQIKLYATEENKRFFCPSMINLMDYIIKFPYKFNPAADSYAFLHNIYYNYISYSKEYGINNNKYVSSKISYFLEDARKTLQVLQKKYDFVFLDAYSPQKDPSLWTIDFLRLVKSKMSNDSILVSYSKSTPFRSALTELNFYVGKTYIENIDMGTVASLNSKYIKNKLSQFDIGLINTRSGITYKDANLNLASKEILLNREKEQTLSSRISHTAFLKQK